MKHYWLIVCSCATLFALPAQADVLGEDLIPELRDIERIAAEQEAAIRAQSDVLKKAQLEKETAAKAAEEAIAQQKAQETAAQQAIVRQVAERQATQAKPVAKTAATNNTAAKKSSTTARKPAEPVSPWLAQERRYSYP